MHEVEPDQQKAHHLSDVIPKLLDAHRSMFRQKRIAEHKPKAKSRRCFNEIIGDLMSCEIMESWFAAAAVDQWRSWNVLIQDRLEHLKLSSLIMH